jgi:PAS domain S-box-containing protein
MSMLARIAEVLEREGMTEELAELRRLEGTARAAEAHQQTIAEVTRALLESEKTYRLVFSHEMDPMSLFEPGSGKILDVNDAWLSLYGYTREEALSMRVMDVSAEPADTRARNARLETGGTTRINVRWHRAKDGTVFPVELTAGSLMLGGREVMYASMRDVNQRQSVERALTRTAKSFRALIESMPDGVIVHRHGELVYLNPSARRMLGYADDEDVRGRAALELVHPDDRELVARRVTAIITHGTVAPLLEERLVRRDGRALVAEIAGIGVEFDGEPAVLAIARDVTERKKMERELVMNDRLASLGRLSASVGHELNNPLAYVLGNVSLLERELSRGEALGVDRVERCLRYVRTIAEGASRMRHVVHDLKTLARADVEERVAVDVQHLLDVCANMAEHEVGPRARLHKEYRAKATVRGSEARLGQVFLNLLINAAQAIAPGAPEDNEIRIVLREERSRVVVEIADTGNGIAAADRDRIFEPFFTTKEGTGTGLGLSISHGIVTELGGTISLEPRADRGTIFRVDLPAFEPPPPRQA